MSETWSKWLLSLILSLGAGGYGPAALAGLGNSWSLSGYYKNLFVASRTLPSFGPQERYDLDLNRLRIKLRGGLGEAAALEVQYDNELLLGSYLETLQFAALDAMGSDTYFDWDGTYVSRDDLVARHSLYRAHITLTGTRAELRVGRQRLAWGTALFWNPVDILNPFNPVQLEREERTGVDAVLLGWDYGALSRLSVVGARQRSGDSVALRWRGNWRGFDLALTGGRFRGDEVAGFDFAGQLGLIGLRGEATRTRSEKDGSYTRVVLGADRSFANTLTLNLELYYNGQGRGDTRDYEFMRLVSGEVVSLARYYGAFFLGYELTPLLRWDNYVILNLDDDSRFLAPRLVYSPTGSLDWALGVQYFDGPTDSEYGVLETLFFSELQWFF